MKKQWLIATSIIVISFSLIPYGNLIVKRGGILGGGTTDKVLLNTKDPYYVMDQKVKELVLEGLKTGEQVVFVIPFDGEMTRDDLSRVRLITEKTQEALPDIGVLSLSTAALYQDDGGELKSDPYVTADELADPQFNLGAWKEAVKSDPGVYGLLIGRNFDYAQVVLFLPVDCDEAETFWRIVELLEGRLISIIKRYFKTDIYPSGDFVKVLPGGWINGRGLTDAVLLRDVLIYATIGLCVSWLLYLVHLASLRKATVATFMVALSFFWTRGTIGILQRMGVPVYERVYILLVFAAQIVVGISFCEHKFACYQEMRRQFPNASRVEIWRRSTGVNESILVTAIIAILTFSTLYQIGVRGIMEVGMLVCIGIVFLVVFTFWFLPAIHSIVGGETREKNPTKISAWWDKQLGRVISAVCFFLLLKPEQNFHWQKRARFALVIIGLFVGCAVCLALSGRLTVRTRPLEYIHGTVVYRASQFLQEPGRYGFDRISFLVRSKKPNISPAITDPLFIAEVASLGRRLQNRSDIREVNSVVDTLSVIARETYHAELPQTQQQVYDSLQLIEFDLNPLVKEQLWYDGGLVMFASTDTMDDSNSMGKSCDAIVALGKQFPSLEILPFGKVPAYPRADKYIREGKPKNLLSSQWIIVFVYAAWIGWRNRRHPAHTHLFAWRTGFVMNAPFIFATSVIVIIMAWFNIALDQVMACFSALAINAAADFGLYLMAEFDKLLRQGMRMQEAMCRAFINKGKDVLNDICLNCFCFAPLMLSHFIPIQRLGWVMIVMLLACGIGVVFQMALLPWCVKKVKS
ncbi:hypothetical protein COU00_04035 [Candidatus Falkowbacteria bacterium CG10_big_fil_rev_8_21_14_0_10_43_11]|uniref:Membrane transport protein MMPL domain-containing protein n=1 Tax=Candidatus Falkowbacteria bacterium CG10_big_fil_rev_8_21_14_0_10_43_11 TaxID=1974568 RepID=A0A2M6WL36_9BACT|nr:MAG: hypothetical protein COU00_04035 [Candidatus Falkowbacteria bacterium CG10_big_fil_rev_8_21_14_0_10_43_11]